MSCNSNWEDRRIVNNDGAIHYTINVQKAPLRRQIDQILGVAEAIHDNNYVLNLCR